MHECLFQTIMLSTKYTQNITMQLIYNLDSGQNYLLQNVHNIYQNVTDKSVEIKNWFFVVAVHASVVQTFSL